MNKALLSAKMAENGDTQASLAEAIGVSLSRFNAKINETGGAEFSLGEVKSIRKRYSLDSAQTAAIFF